MMSRGEEVAHPLDGTDFMAVDLAHCIFYSTVMHSKVMSCVGPFPMAEWLRNVIIGWVELLKALCGAGGSSESTFSLLIWEIL